MIIGVTGLIASGKDTFADFLIERGFEKLSLSDEIREDLRKEGKPLIRYNERAKGTELRQKFGNSILAKRVAEKIDPAKNYVIVSIRNPGEVEEFRKLDNFTLVSVQASDDKRFELMKKGLKEQNKADRTDSLEEMKEMDEKEFSPDDPSANQLKKTISMADHTIKNEGTLEDLENEIEGFLRRGG